MMGADKSGGGDTVLGRQLWKLGGGDLERAIAKAMRHVDHQCSRTGPIQFWVGMAIDLADTGLGGIAVDAGQAVTLLTVDLGLDQRTGNGGGVRAADIIIGQIAGDQVLQA